MNKLKTKVFLTILFILTGSLLSFLIVFNVRGYMIEKSSIKDTLTKIQNNKDHNNKIKPEFNNINDNYINRNLPLNEDAIFMDKTVYTIILNENDEIESIINHTQDSTDSDIESDAKKILGNIESNLYIGNLLFDDYSYLYNKGNSLIVIDNEPIKNKLISNLLLSSIIFIIIELIIIIITKLITVWITKPVSNAFNKQKQFIEDASHELKTPLSVIIASSEAAISNPRETKWLNNIQNEADRMNILIKDLLELASLEREQTQVLELGNLSKLVELSLLTFEAKIYESNLKLDYKIDENINIKMNKNNIRQLVEILLDNAIKHANKKSTINIILEDKNNECILYVKNEGKPIPKEDEEKIFERFYRVDKSRNRNENRYGLGLAIAKSITENHNGKISASSKDGITTFKVVLKK